ncbi:MAG: AMP-dependent synthetase/ligase [Halobacteriales archaeon]
MESDWRQAEKEYDDEVIGWNTVPEAIEASAERRLSEAASMYKGGVYDRALVPDVIDESPDGEFTSLTYDEFRSIYRRIAAGFDNLGVSKGDRVGIFANTRLEWALSDFALLSRGGVVTSVYSSSSPRQTRYLLDDPGASGVVVENQELLERVLEVEDDLELDFIVSMDEVDDEHLERDNVHTLDEVYAIGDEAFDEDRFNDWLDNLSLNDLCTLIYTSGTTGQPKGVRLTHRNFRSSINQARKRFGPRPDKPDDVPSIDETDRVVSFLPLAHAFERYGSFLMYASGATVAYAESPDTLQEDFSAVSPTTGTSVPRVYEKVYDAIREQASGSGAKKRIFEWAEGVGERYHKEDSPGAWLSAKHAVADRLVFSNVREALGGEIEFMISGGGSLSADLCALYHGMGLPILEGYGLTETAPIVSANPPEEPKIGTIGPAIPDIETKLDVDAAPEEVRNNGNVGELLVRGPNVTDGYWEKPDETAASFTEADDGGDDWFRTGDVVRVDDDGYMTFVDRAKELIVLSTGKNVPPQPIEDEFSTSTLVEQCMVVGSEEKFIGALMVPNFEGLRKRAEKEGVELPDNNEDIVNDERVRSWIQEEVDAANENFEKYETIKKFRLVADEWTEENDLLTPSLKKKRRNILEKHRGAVDGIYAEEEE